tara:strand:+ start:493 stop:633 length:141 start_codon:yes stop_codon:yes gene_type:complete
MVNMNEDEILSPQLINELFNMVGDLLNEIEENKKEQIKYMKGVNNG